MAASISWSAKKPPIVARVCIGSSSPRIFEARSGSAIPWRHSSAPIRWMLPIWTATATWISSQASIGGRENWHLEKLQSRNKLDRGFDRYGQRESPRGQGGGSE